MRRKTNIIVPLAAATALAVPVASQAGGHTPKPPTTPGTQQLKLLAWQSKGDAAWQKRTWQKSRAWCMDKVNGTPRWRSVLAQGKCGTVVKSDKLAKDVVYQVTVKGLISHWSGTWRKTCGSPIASNDPTRGGAGFNASADPQWTFANKKGTFWCKVLGPHLPTVGAGFRINADPSGAPKGWKYPWMGQSRTYVRTNHTYTFTVKGSGKSVAFGIYDHWVTDNYGSFDITIAPASAPTSG